MADAPGRKVAVGLAKEAVRGTPVTAAFWASWIDLDYHPKVNKVQNESAIYNLEQYSGAEVVQSWAEGKLGGIVTDKTIGLILYALFGSYAVAAHGADTTAKDHTFTESQTAQAQSLTVTRVDQNIDEQYPLTMIKSFEMTITAGEYVKFSAEMISTLGTTNVDTVTYVAENIFKAKHATIKIAANVAGLGAATAIPLRELKLTIDKGVNPYWIIGQNNPGEIFATQTNIKGDFVLRYTDTTYKALVFNNTNQVLQIDLKNTDVNIGSVPSNPELVLTFYNVSFDDWTPAQDRTKINEQTIAFLGFWDYTTAQGMKAVLTNLQTTY